jgi:2-dehydro-3-deoxygluconokinase
VSNFAERSLSYGKSLCIFGEVMIELSPLLTAKHANQQQNNMLNIGFAGDTFNTAVSLARTGCHVQYLTRLGDDKLSTQILDLMNREGLGYEEVEIEPGRQPGLYMIENSPGGERMFRYWRNESPARELFDSEKKIDRLVEKCSSSAAVYFSGISLGILSDCARERLIEQLLVCKENGILIIFDSNFRASLWDSVSHARKICSKIMSMADVALLTVEDEESIWGLNGVDELIALYKQQFNIDEIVIKRGAMSTLIVHEGNISEVPVQKVDKIIDTSGAGDAFNAGYISGRLSGKSPRNSAELGNVFASAIIQKKGAIVDKKYFLKEVATWLS